MSEVSVFRFQVSVFVFLLLTPDPPPAENLHTRKSGAWNLVFQYSTTQKLHEYRSTRKIPLKYSLGVARFSRPEVSTYGKLLT